MTKLTMEQVEDIRWRMATGRFFMTDIAKEHGVGVATIYRVVHKKSFMGPRRGKGELVGRRPQATFGKARLLISPTNNSVEVDGKGRGGEGGGGGSDDNKEAEEGEEGEGGAV